MIFTAKHTEHAEISRRAKVKRQKEKPVIVPFVFSLHAEKLLPTCLNIYHLCALRVLGGELLLPEAQSLRFQEGRSHMTAVLPDVQRRGPGESNCSHLVGLLVGCFLDMPSREA